MALPEERSWEELVAASLSMVKENDLTKREWANTKFAVEDLFKVILPPWDTLTSETKRMCPPITVTEEGASFKLADMEELTAKR